MSNKLLIYSIQLYNRPAIARAVELIGTPDEFDANSISSNKLSNLLTAVANLHLQNDCDFLRFDEVNKTLSTQSFINFNNDAVFKLIRITGMDSSFGMFYRHTETNLKTLNYNLLAPL